MRSLGIPFSFVFASHSRDMFVACPLRDSPLHALLLGRLVFFFLVQKCHFLFPLFARCHSLSGGSSGPKAMMVIRTTSASDRCRVYSPGASARVCRQRRLVSLLFRHIQRNGAPRISCSSIFRVQHPSLVLLFEAFNVPSYFLYFYGRPRTSHSVFLLLFPFCLFASLDLLEHDVSWTNRSFIVFAFTHTSASPSSFEMFLHHLFFF